MLKSRDITLPTKVCLVKAMVLPAVVLPVVVLPVVVLPVVVLPAVMCGREIWAEKKADAKELMPSNCDAGEDS